MLLHASAHPGALSRPQACSRNSNATRPVAGCAARGLLRPQLINRTAGTAPKLCDTRTRAVRADQATETLDSALLQTIAQITEQVDAAVASTLAASAEAAAVTAPPSGSELRAKVVRGVEKLQKGLLERETEVRLLLLASLCGEHLLLLGPPGTAKSELARRLSGLAQGAYFERLLTRFSVPEELFGPLSMQGLENDRYVRKTEGYLPTAEVAFVDEIFKANSAILNALLTLLNERLFDNGNERLPVPLLCLVGASNELPESEELDALYDRFLIRRTVAQVTNAQVGKLARLAAGRPADSSESSNGNGSGSSGPELVMDDFRHTAEGAYAAVDVPDTVVDILAELRCYLQDKCEPPMYVSDRRFMKAVQMLQVAAHADGRAAVNEYDCLLLEYVFGNRPDDSHKVRAQVLEIIASDPGLQQTELVFLGLFGRSCRVLEQSPDGAEAADALTECSTLVELLKARQAALAATLEGAFPELRSTIWQSEASVQAAVQSLTPQITENKRKTEELLREAYTLRTCLSQRVSAGVLEKLLPKRYKQYSKGIGSKN